MGKLNAMIRKLYQTEWARWAFAALVALFVLAFAAATTTITFYENDDLNIAWALAGYRSGTPSFSHPFVNCVTAFLVSSLYALLPSIPWWLAFQLCGMFLGMTAVGAGALKIAFSRRAPLLLPVLLMGMFCAGLFFYPVVLVTFTTSSAILGAGAAALALAFDRDDSKRLQRLYVALIALLLAGSLLVRNSSGLAAACFVLGALMCRIVRFLLEKDRLHARRMLRCALVCAVTLIALVDLNAYGRKALNPDGFLAFEEARASYMDYPHDGYGQIPSVYDENGWNATLVSLVDAWFYMDENVTAEAFNRIVGASSYARMGVSERVAYSARALGAFLSKYQLARYLGALLLMGVAALIVMALFHRRNWQPFVTGLLLALGGAALIAYLLYAGRINLRVWMSVCIPTCVCVWLCVLALYRREGVGPRLRLARGALIGALLLASLFCSYKTMRTVLSYESDEMLARSQAVTQYALDHPQNVYIRDVYVANNVDALSVYPERKPTNLLDWGGCDMYTRARTAQLERNGLPTPYADAFLLDNVYYVCEPAQPYLPLLASYMRERYGAKYEIADDIREGISAVKFTIGGTG